MDGDGDVEAARLEPGRAIEEYGRLVDGIVWAHQWRARAAGVDLEDLRQEALLGLMAAAAAWEPARGPFPPFAGSAIRNRLRNAFRAARRRRPAADPTPLAAVPDRPDGTPGPAVLRRLEAACEAIDALPHVYRRLAILRYGLDRTGPDGGPAGRSILEAARAARVGEHSARRMLGEIEAHIRDFVARDE